MAMEEGHFAKEIAAVAVKGRKGAVTEVRVTSDLSFTLTVVKNINNY